MWYDKAYDELEQLSADGEISQEEFRREMRFLREEIECSGSHVPPESYEY